MFSCVEINNGLFCKKSGIEAASPVVKLNIINYTVKEAERLLFCEREFGNDCKWAKNTGYI